MMKKLLLGVSTLAAAPVLAQQPAPLAQTAPAPVPTVPVTATPAPIVPAQPASAQPALAQPAPVQPAAAGTEVASIVAREFPSYDRDRDGSLNQSEFAEWMIRLKTIADPASTANEAATKTWVNAAFAQADADRSRLLTLGELTGFLLQGQA